MSIFFFFNDTATTEIYTLSLHDALPISLRDDQTARTDSAWGPLLPCTISNSTRWFSRSSRKPLAWIAEWCTNTSGPDRKSTRLNSSHLVISYAVFCLKKKHNTPHHTVCF